MTLHNLSLCLAFPWAVLLYLILYLVELSKKKLMRHLIAYLINLKNKIYCGIILYLEEEKKLSKHSITFIDYFFRYKQLQ